MAKLISMKLSPAEAKEEAPVKPTPPLYPWGLTISLDKEVLDKLGIEGEAEADAEVRIAARGVVTGYSVHKEQGGEERRCLTIQITDLALEPEDDDETKRVFYPASRAG